MSVTCIKCATTLCAPNFLLPGVRLKLALFSLVLLLRSNLLEIFHFDTDHKDKGWQSVVFFFRGRYFIWIMIFNGLWSKTVSCSVVRFWVVLIFRGGLHHSLTRSLSRKSAIDKVKIAVVNGIISWPESVSEKSELFHLLPIPLVTPKLMIQWKLNCRSRRQRWKNKPITMRVLRPSDRFQSDNPVFTGS